MSEEFEQTIKTERQSTMASKQLTPAQQEKAKADMIAKQRAKEAVQAQKDERAKELDAPVEDVPSSETQEQPTEESVASLAAKGLQDGGSLTDDEVQRVSGAALGKADDEATDEPADQEGDATDENGTDIPEVTLEGVALSLAKIGFKLSALEAAIADVERRLRLTEDEVKPRGHDGTYAGSIDSL